MLFAAAVMVAVLFLPHWDKVDSHTMEYVKLDAFNLGHFLVNADGTETMVASKSVSWISVLASCSAFLALASIFQYKNRVLQVNLGAFNSMIMAACICSSYYCSTMGEKLIMPDTAGNFQVGFYIIAVAILFNSLSNKFIRRDEKLVKSADRIR